MSNMSDNYNKIAYSNATDHNFSKLKQNSKLTNKIFNS